MKEDCQTLFWIGDFEDLLEIFPEEWRGVFNEQRDVHHRPLHELENGEAVRKETKKRMVSHVVNIRHVEQLFFTLQAADRW